jgi:hypothetical protein
MTARPRLPRLRLAAVAVAMLCGGPACRGVDELVASVNARVFVVGVDGASVVRVAVDDQRVEGRASAGSNVATFALALAPGEHDGTVVVLGGLASDREDDPDDDDADDDDDDDDRCGTFALDVTADSVVELAIVADDLPRCRDGGDDVDDSEGEARDDAGEGEGEGEERDGIDDIDDDTGEGEGEGDSDEAPEGEGDPPPDEPGEGEGE